MKDTEFTLAEYADLYAKRKAEQKVLEAEIKSLNDRLKRLMEEQDTLEAEGKNATVKYVVQKRESFDEEKAITVLKQFCPSVIKTREYVDMDALENELYNETIPALGLAELDKCRNVKNVVTLTISKRKNK